MKVIAIVFYFLNHSLVIVVNRVDLHLILVKVIVCLLNILILEQSNRELLFFGVLEDRVRVNKQGH